MKKAFYILLIASLFLSGCSATKRLERLLHRNPHLTAIDTVVIHHETILPEIKFRDRYITQPNDTITIEKENTRVQVIRQFDSIFVEIDRPPDTIREQIKVPVEVIRYETPNAWHMFWKRIPWIIIGAIIILTIIFYRK